jgi:hypothetical protein
VSERGAALFVQLEPPPALLEEFHAWYDTEHLPERARIPGFETTVRLVCRDGWPAYAGFYDLAHIGVLEEAPYRSITGENASAWSRRLVSRCVGYDRLLLEQVAGGGPLPAGHEGLAVLRFAAADPPAIAAGAERLAEGMSGRHRVFRRTGARAETVAVFDAPALELIPSWTARELAAAFEAAAGSLLGVWRYARYHRQG